MGNSRTDDGPAADAGEQKLRGDALDGPEQKRAADHTAYQGKRKPDRVVRIDGEPDTLYQDGLDLEGDEPSPPMGTSSSP
jgi:hypothetical protein